MLPVAQAGPDQVFPASPLPVTATLAGDATYPPILAWEWTMVSVPDGSETNIGNKGSFYNGISTARNPEMICDVLGTYVLQLRAQNGDGWSIPQDDKEVGQTVVFVTTAGLAWKLPGFKQYRGDVRMSELLGAYEGALGDHSARHEDGGADEISVEGLSGTLAEGQTPVAHADEHAYEGGDQVSMQGLSGALTDPQNIDKIQSRDVNSAMPDTGSLLVWSTALDPDRWTGDQLRKLEMPGTTVSLTDGDAAYISATSTFSKALNDTAAHADCVGVYEGKSGRITSGGIARVSMVNGLTPTLNAPVYVSNEAGKLTTVLPLGFACEVGFIVDASEYSSGKKCRIRISKKQFKLIDPLLNAVVVIGGSPPYQSGPEKWSYVGGGISGAGTMVLTARIRHRAFLLDDGRVFMPGSANFGGGYPIGSCDMYTRSTNSWAAAASMLSARFDYGGCKCSDGRIAIVGGVWNDLLHASTGGQIYTPGTNSWAEIPTQGKDAGVDIAFCNNELVQLDDGRLFTCAGYGHPNSETKKWAWAFNLSTWGWTRLADLSRLRRYYAMAKLNDGRILVIGGDEGSGYNTCEIYTVGTNSWAPTGSMAVGRRNPACVKLPDGNILVIGGGSTTDAELSSVELYSVSGGTWTTKTSMPGPKKGIKDSTVMLPDGRIWVGGGGGGDEGKIYIYTPSTDSWITAGTTSNTHGRTAACFVP